MVYISKKIGTKNESCDGVKNYQVAKNLRNMKKGVMPIDSKSWKILNKMGNI